MQYPIPKNVTTEFAYPCHLKAETRQSHAGITLCAAMIDVERWRICECDARRWTERHHGLAKSDQVVAHRELSKRRSRASGISESAPLPSLADCGLELCDGVAM